MSMKRRDFIKIAGTAGLGLVAGSSWKAQASEGADPANPEFKALLIDTTLCVGCRACEGACNEANNLPKPEKDFSDTSVLDQNRDTTPTAYKVVNKFANPKDPENPIFVPKQCLHCNQPACASACLTHALEKTKEGPVVYHGDRCLGCRYCMLACPFEIPKYEYDSPLPYVKKCVFCFDKIKAGEQPACAAACPMGATKFGTRRELLEEARNRIYTNPGKYHNHIYGDHEVGGTGVMYLAAAPFDKIGFKTNLGGKPYPELTQGFLTSVPLVFVMWPALLAGLSSIVKGEKKEEQGENEKESHHE